MTNWLTNTNYIISYATLWSAMEVEIEGPEGGWAKNLPTSNFFKTHFTWYHIIMNTIVILTLYRSFYKNTIVSKIFYITSWFLIEDYLWFMINPGFGIKKYTKKDIWWHGKQVWIFGQPFHNYLSLSIMVACCHKKKKLYKSLVYIINYILFATFINYKLQ